MRKGSTWLELDDPSCGHAAVPVQVSGPTAVEISPPMVSPTWRQAPLRPLGRIPSSQDAAADALNDGNYNVLRIAYMRVYNV